MGNRVYIYINYDDEFILLCLPPTVRLVSTCVFNKINLGWLPNVMWPGYILIPFKSLHNRLPYVKAESRPAVRWPASPLVPLLIVSARLGYQSKRVLFREVISTLQERGRKEESINSLQKGWQIFKHLHICNCADESLIKSELQSWKLSLDGNSWPHSVI